MNERSMPTCPICNADVKPRAENRAFPFCTARCQTIDLGKWVNEEYRVSIESDEADEDGEGPFGGSKPEDVQH